MRRRQPLRFATVGSVDDGKSTLIGRLLFDSKSIFEDQLEHVTAVSRRRGDEYVDLALRHRRFARRARAGHHDRCRLPLLLDAGARLHHRRLPGSRPVHAQHDHRGVDRRPGRSCSIDARKGVLEQTRRHSLLVSLLGVPHLVICVNKMDLVDHSESRFDEIRDEFTSSPARSTSTTSRSSRSRRSTATTSSTARPRWAGTRDRRCSTISRRCTSPATTT